MPKWKGDLGGGEGSGKEEKNKIKCKLSKWSTLRWENPRNI